MNLILVEKEHLTDNVWSFRFKPDRPLSWTAGQFIQVDLPHDQPDAEGTKRWFTVSSAPSEGVIQITTRVTGTTFKQALSKLNVGDKLTLLAEPDGDFIWSDSDRPQVYVAGGIGITPFRSILAERFHGHQPIKITLVYGSRTPDVPFKEEIADWEKGGLTAKYVTGEPVTAAKLAELVPDLNESAVYVSGPEPMVEALGDQLKAAGLPEAQLHQDFFPNYTESNY